MSKFSAIGLAHKLFVAAVEQVYTQELLNILAEDSDLFRQLLAVQSGGARVVMAEHIIDCDADPYVPWNMVVEKHQKDGPFRWDSTKVGILPFIYEKYEGNPFRKEFENKPVLNANVLDYLLANTYLIPKEWRNKRVSFPGTIYRIKNSNGALVGVACLRHFNDMWNRSFHYFDETFDCDTFIALRAS